jgi:superfamily II DNA or RNA helicase
MELRFDGGTLFLDGGAPPPSVRNLPWFREDARIGTWRAPAFRAAELWRALSEAGVRLSDRICPAPDGPGQPATTVLLSTLRPYQSAALASWEGAGRRGIVVLPTGAGKTRVGIAAALTTARPTLFLVPTRVLLHQWVEAIAGSTGRAPGVLGDGRHEIRDWTVTTFESAWRGMARLGDRFDLLVVDEAHHFGLGVRDEALEMSVAAHRLGLTATPPSAEAQLRLGEILGPVVYELAVGDLAGTWLADFDVVRLALALDAEERERYCTLMNTFHGFADPFFRETPEAAWPDLVRAASRRTEGRIALRALAEARRFVAFPRAKRTVLGTLLARYRDDRVLVFTTDNETALSIAQEHLLMPITCDIGKREREEALARFRDGRLRALVSARVLNEGVDVPDARVGIVVGGAHGEREHVQRVGRLLRKSGDKRAVLYELVMRGTLEERSAERRARGLAARSAALV